MARERRARVARRCRSARDAYPALRLGASGFDEIQGHAFFAFTQWDLMTDATPPFVPTLAGGDDDAYFPRTLLPGGGADNAIHSDSSEDSESESFKKIQGVNVDHLISLARRPSQKGLSASPASGSPSNSTPSASITATPPSVSRNLGQKKVKSASKLGPSAQGNRPLSRPLSRQL